jgi:hypothetical protein
MLPDNKYLLFPFPFHAAAAVIALHNVMRG